MFIQYNNASAVRYTGRWAYSGNSAVATAAGSTIDIAFNGDMALLHFNMDYSEHPFPHLWVSIDGGAKVEVPMDSYLRLNPSDNGSHTAKIIYKGAVEMQHRWYSPLIGKIAFLGFEAESAAVLPDDNHKTIEFVGDSITEGVLIDAMYNPHKLDQLNRPYQDDVTATYAYLTAMALNLRPLMMGYGAVGLTRGGCGSVPRAVEAYPYCFAGAPVTYGSPDYIVINHGANDQGATPETYIKAYSELLDFIRKRNPDSKIIVLGAFCGAFASQLAEFVPAYNTDHNDSVYFVDTTGWIPKSPLHPLRDGHRIVAEKLTAILKNLL